MVQTFLDLLKRNKYPYIVAASLIAAIVLINNVLDFADKIIKNPLLLSLGVVIFIFFITISIKEEIWKNEK